MICQAEFISIKIFNTRHSFPNDWNDLLLLTSWFFHSYFIPGMKKYALTFLMALISLLLFSSSAFPFGGPLQVKNQFPLFLTLNPPYLETASYDNSLSISLSHSSIFMVKSSPSWSVSLDMELTELNLRYKKDIGNLFEIGFEIPLVSFNSGFMDNFLDSYHKTFGFPDYGRSNRPNDEFFYEVKWIEQGPEKVGFSEFTMDPTKLFEDFVQRNYEKDPRKEEILREGTAVLREVLQ